MKRSKQVKTLLLLFGIFVAVALISSVVGAADVTVGNVLKIIGSKIPGIKQGINLEDVSKAQQAIVWNIRVPRILLAFLVGYGLSVVGTTMQGLLKNPMADPYIIGISSGAALGAAMAIVLKLNTTLLGMGMVSICAFIGALLATLLVYQLARVKGKVPVTTLLLAGIAIGQLLTSIMSLLMVIYSKDVNTIIYWTLGSFSSRSWSHVQVAVIPILAGSLLIYFYAKDLNVLLLGEATAESTGVEVERVKVLLLMVSALMTAFAVSVSGIIGFVGLIVPHIVRILLGPDHRTLIPASGLVGGIFMILADTLARTLIAPTEIPVGIITAIAGGPFFISLLRKAKRGV